MVLLVAHVVYSVVSRVLRSVVISSAPDEPLPIAPGDTTFTIPLDDTSDRVCRDAIAHATGHPVPSGRCCVVNGNQDIVGICMADAVADTHPDGTLLAHDTAGVGDRIRSGVVQRRFAVVNQSTRIVVAIVWLPLQNPTTAPGTTLMSPGNLQVGDTIPTRPHPI